MCNKYRNTAAATVGSGVLMSLNVAQGLTNGCGNVPCGGGAVAVLDNSKLDAAVGALFMNNR